MEHIVKKNYKISHMKNYRLGTVARKRQTRLTSLFLVNYPISGAIASYMKNVISFILEQNKKPLNINILRWLSTCQFSVKLWVVSIHHIHFCGFLFWINVFLTNLLLRYRCHHNFSTNWEIFALEYSSIVLLSLA